ncbi:MAG: FHA domain-containing protein [Chloroflexi bacterium]|nr:FHA domain-containing protein [Chloroflexota bacterium]MBU1660625.1 FHA domain-containing protein [Chloroflexota bacterium]
MASQPFQLVMQAGPTPRKTFTLSGNEIVIGRDINADIVINTAELSRRHARLRLGDGGYILEDLGSTNGTFVNGQRLTAPRVMRPGETIMLGETVALMYGGIQFDPDATVISASSSAATMFAQEPVTPLPRTFSPSPPPPPIPQPFQPNAPVYSGQVPAGPVFSADPMPDDEGKGKTWLWAGLGCVGIVLCVLVVGVIAFDMLNLYCTPPFNALFSACP